MSPCILTLSAFILLIDLTLCFSNANIFENGLAKVCYPLERTLDLLFILDGSGSVKGETFDTQRDMVRSVINLIDISENKTRVAVIQYSGYTRIEFPFDTYTTKEEINIALDNMSHLSGTTKTGKALLKARNLFDSEFGGRKGIEKVAQVVVVVSDGHSHDDPVPAADLLKEDGIKIVAMGIGNHINMDELKQIANEVELAFTNDTMPQFVDAFKTIAIGEKCQFSKGSNGAETACESDVIKVEIETALPFEGIFYVSGYLNDNKCRVQAINHYKSVTLKIPLHQCGLNHQTMLSPRGVLFSTSVILQYHPDYHTLIDEHFSINCFYSDSSDPSSSTHQLSALRNMPLHLSPSIHSHLYDEKTIQMADPDLYRISINDMNAVCVYSVKRRNAESCDLDSGKLGETVTHSWICDNDVISGDYAMKVHSCFMEDVREDGLKIMVIDSHGCSLDPMIMTEPYYSPDKPLRVSASGTLVQLVGSSLTFRCSITFCNRLDGSCDDFFSHQCDRKPREKRQTEGMPAHMIKRLFARRRFLQFQHQQHAKQTSNENLVDTNLQTISGENTPFSPLFTSHEALLQPGAWVQASTASPEQLQTFTTHPRRTKLIFSVTPVVVNKVQIINDQIEEQTVPEQDHLTRTVSHYSPVNEIHQQSSSQSSWFEKDSVYKHPIVPEDEETLSETENLNHEAYEYESTPLVVFGDNSGSKVYNSQNLLPLTDEEHSSKFDPKTIEDSEDEELTDNPSLPRLLTDAEYEAAIAQIQHKSEHSYEEVVDVEASIDYPSPTQKSRTFIVHADLPIQPKNDKDTQYDYASITNHPDKDTVASKEWVTVHTEDPVTAPIEDWVTVQNDDRATVPTEGSVTVPTEGSVTVPTENGVTVPTENSVTVPNKSTEKPSPKITDMNLHGLSPKIIKQINLNTFILKSQIILVRDEWYKTSNACIR